MSSAAEMRPDSGNDGSHDDSAAREDITLDGPLDSRFGTKNQLAGSSKAASNRAIDASLSGNRHQALEASVARNQEKSDRMRRFVRQRMRPAPLSICGIYSMGIVRGVSGHV
jgi:hypothetical protein